MKAKNAIEILSSFIGDELFKKASEIYREEVHRVISIRCHGNKPTSNVIDGAINEVSGWFKKVCRDIKCDDENIPNRIIEYERGGFWVKDGIMDSKLVDWGKRTRKAALEGKFLPALAALKPGDLEAAVS